MDKRSNVVASVMMVLVLVLARNVQADFKSCMGTCLLGCIVDPNKILCGVKCIGKCIISGGGGCSLEHNYCKLGCAMEKCTTALDSGFGIEKVEELDTCVNMCQVEECGLIPATACPPSSLLA